MNITEQAKKIMDSFVAELSKVGEQDSNFKVKRKISLRPAIVLKQSDFRTRMFDNAPSVKNNCIAAERKKW